MGRTLRRRTNISTRIASLIAYLLQTIARASLYLILEFTVYIAVGVVAIALISLGLPGDVVIGLSLAVVALSLTVSFLAYRQHRVITSRPARAISLQRIRGELKLADWIAQTLSTKAPQEWEEYQDWLHDILLARRQLLEIEYPHWKITVITYWRLTGLCLTVSLIKLRRWAIAVRRRLR